MSLNRSYLTRTILALSSSVLLVFQASAGEPSPAKHIVGTYEAFVLAEGLQSPDGIAVHPISGEVYVTDEAAGQIYVIRDGQPVSALSTDWTVKDQVSGWAVARLDRSHWLKARLHSPEGIHFAPDGRLYVTEDVANGRLLEFAPGKNGIYSQAEVIPIPWLDRKYEWESVLAAKDGRLFVAGSSTSYGPGLFFGAVLMRDADGVWFAVDYAPFAAFSSLALSRDEDILVVGEEFPGAVTWWDTDRHRDVGGALELVPDVESVAVLPSGAILMVQESGETGGRLLMLDPTSREISVAAEGFGTIESVVANPTSGVLYVSEDSSGRIFELRPRSAEPKGEYLLSRSLRVFESEQGFAPKAWPGFMKDFVGRLGIETRDASEIAAKSGEGFFDEPISLEQFAEKIPLVAGKIKAAPKPGYETEDPIEEIDFVAFYPNEMVKSGQAVMPSLSLFAARHQSGKVSKSRLLSSFEGRKRVGPGEYAKVADKTWMFVPMTTCATTPGREGTRVTLSFLGMGLSPDYHMALTLGDTVDGYMFEEDRAGNRTHYSVDFSSPQPDGTDAVNLVVAGIQAKTRDNINWMEIGTQPGMSLLSLGDMDGGWVSRWIQRRDPGLVAMINEQREEKVKALDDYLNRLPPTELASPPRPATPEPPAKEREQRAQVAIPSGSEPITQAGNEQLVDDVWTNLLLTRAVAAWDASQF